MNVTHFATAAEFRAWLEKNHATAPELWVGFFRKGSGQPGMTYAEAVDEALCFGWIDGIIKKLDHERFTHRFTPRRPNSIWSKINVGHVARLSAAGKMHAAGLAAFAARTAARTGVYAFEQAKPKSLSRTDEKLFRAHKAAWAFFSAQAAWYRRNTSRWVVSAKQEATRQRRLERLIAASAEGKRL